MLTLALTLTLTLTLALTLTLTLTLTLALTLPLTLTMQVLLGSDGRGGDPLALDRVQVAALVATAAKFGAACETVERFRELDVMEEAKVAWLARRDVTGPTSGPHRRLTPTPTLTLTLTPTLTQP